MPVELKPVELDSYLLTLPGTGYDLGLDINRFQKDLQEFGVDSAAASITENMRAYWREYLVRLSVLPIPIEVQEEGGKKEVVCPRYGNRCLIDTVSSKERKGAAKLSTQQTVELLENEKVLPGSMVLWTSPPGDAGWRLDNGDPVIYPETQTYIYRINEKGQIDAVTVVTDISVEQNRKLLEYFGWREEFYDYPTDWDLGEKITGTVLYFDSQIDEPRDFGSIIDALEEVKGSPFARGEVTFNEIRQLIDRKDELAKAEERVEKIIQDFKGWVVKNIKDNSAESLNILKLEIGRTILKIASYQLQTTNPHEALAYLQSLPGCAGGGLLPRTVVNAEGGPKGCCLLCGRFTNLICGYCQECGKLV
jgi:hypothetical protein